MTGHRIRIGTPGRTAFGGVAVVAALALGAASLPSAAALAARTSTSAGKAAGGVVDYCHGQCSDILPPGENGNETLLQILAFKAFGIRPAHNDDQLAPYANLESAYTGLTDGQIDDFFDNSSFGVPADQVASTQHPEPGVTIVRDKATGVPHVYGVTRAETEFGAGYAGAEDRLWVMDLLRHIGRAELTSFAGGAPGNRLLEQNLWSQAPYTEADLRAQVTALENDGARGRQLKQDIDNYLAGVNAYVATSKADRDFPGEYDLTGNANPITNAGGPQPFTETDLIAIAAVIGGLFGNGGGQQLQAALVKEAAEQRYGTALGDRLWNALREQNDPETVLTVHDGQRFPYTTTPAHPVGVAMPDPGSVTPVPIVQNPTGSAAQSAAQAAATQRREQRADAATARAAIATARARRARAGGAVSLTPAADLKVAAGLNDAGAMPGLDLPRAGQQHPGMSNALVISAKDSASGHPVAVFGPQTGYFAPQLLMLEEIQGPGISARGVSFAGLNFYVEIGRGPDYAWSATSGEQDITDTYTVPLCAPAGQRPTTDSTYYRYDGACVPMDKLSVHDSWSPTLADSTPAGSYDLVMYRTKYGLVESRGTSHGQPVAFTLLRSTYLHEADSAFGFQMFDDPSVMATPRGFQQAASHIAFTFNWFYLNSGHVAYFNSGANPVRAPGTDPNLPMLADRADQWQGWNPTTNSADYTTPAQHPNSIDQDYYVSWNNKQALDYGAADGNFSFGPVQRADLLNNGIQAFLRTGLRFDRASLTRVMETAATTDLRGSEVLPLLLRVIDSAPVSNAAERQAVQELTAWQQSGSMLLPTSATASAFQQSTAIQLMDAWWPLLVRAEFEPGMGKALYDTTVADMQINESPSGGQQDAPSSGGASSNEAQPHKGSSFQFGWWGFVSKDLRSVLGQRVVDPLPVRYCGGGSLARCRTTLLSTLARAMAEPASAVYPADAYCAAGDQWCADSIVQDPVGGITDAPIGWQNRPTYQQVVEFPAGRD